MNVASLKELAARRADHGRLPADIEKRITSQERRDFATPGDLHIDALMTGFAVAYRNSDFIGEELFPTVRVQKESDKFAIYDYRTYEGRIYATARAPKTAAKTVDWAYSLASYSVEENALAAAVDDRERDNADAFLNPDQRATRAALNALSISREDRIATLARATANYPANHFVTLSGTAQWSDYSGTSDPRIDVDTGRAQMLGAIGVAPNVAIIPWRVLEKMRRHPKVIASVQYVKVTNIENSDIAAYIGMDRIIVAGAVKNTAMEGQAAVLADIWGKDVILAFVDRGATDTETLTWGKTFWKPQNGQLRLTRRFRDDRARTDYFECSELTDERIVAAQAAYIIKAAIA